MATPKKRRRQEEAEAEEAKEGRRRPVQEQGKDRWRQVGQGRQGQGQGRQGRGQGLSVRDLLPGGQAGGG